MSTNNEETIEHGPMTGAAFKVIRERLGLPADWLAEHFDVAVRTARRWENGTSPVPDGVRLGLEQLQAEHDVAVQQLEATLDDLPDPLLVTYRVDSHYAACEPAAGGRPASWHRAIVGDVEARHRGATIVYQEP
ncbi:helix-turn-helix domain-containing protein [Isoptericola sp. QY 916]|uniref:helix-turn-helix domain-containing protein n=1 Tax=Isoptericola sp. QY 916 TaxID=2782570 RepID=UPI003D2FEC6E|nr:transcriptional regulator [Isoptericola sp. QY 916]